ncbi:STAS/SEC14 domain-containing protein [Sungkyunkwania multivorans]|uniref:STAS/SEC14 domain-containing protein n=1 Tax=Sungkyunkwania multivorans TaxID=1173618 RepID=A0ABW3CUR3_9FLAO
MIKQYSLSFGKIKVFDDYIIAEIFEGINLDTALNEILLDICSAHFPKRPFGYISNRVNSYSVDPTVYKYTAKNSNLVAIAVVASGELKKLSANIEKLFFDREFEYFEEIDEAKEWIEHIIKSEKAHSNQS